jgi:hypothetical protein
MTHDDESITTRNAASASATDEIVTTANVDGHDHDFIASVVLPTVTDGEKPNDHENDVLVNAGANRDVVIAPPPKPKRRRRARPADAETIRQREIEIAERESRLKGRIGRAREKIRDLKDLNKTQIAARAKEEREMLEKQESAGRYRLADALLKELAKLPEPNWPTLLTTVVGKLSPEDRAAIRRIIKKLTGEGLPE